jgi:hypothetical protein
VGVIIYGAMARVGCGGSCWWKPVAEIDSIVAAVGGMVMFVLLIYHSDHIRTSVSI